MISSVMSIPRRKFLAFMQKTDKEKALSRNLLFVVWLYGVLSLSPRQSFKVFLPTAGKRQLQTALGVTMKTFSILTAVMIGLGSGAQPILGYNYGAGQYDRVKTAFRYTMMLSVSAMCVAWVFFQFVPEPIVSIFGNNSEMYTRFSVRCPRIFLMAIPLEAVQVMSGNFFQSLGKSAQASVISLPKQFLFMIPMTLLLTLIRSAISAVPHREKTRIDANSPLKSHL